MTIKVHGAPLSPFVRKVRVALTEKKLDYNLQIAVPYDLPEGYEKLNPLRRIPAFEDGEVTLADSAVICHYLEQTHPGTPLLPASPASRAHCEWLEKYADYELAQVSTQILFRETLIVPLIKQQPDPAKIQHAKEEQLPPLLNYLSEQLDSNEWFVEDQFSLADIAIACQLINMEHAGHLLDGTRWPALHAFLHRCYSRDCFSEIVKQERNQVTKVLAHING